MSVYVLVHAYIWHEDERELLKIIQGKDNNEQKSNRKHMLCIAYFQVQCSVLKMYVKIDILA